MRKFKGVVSPIVTPFDSSGRVYEKGFDNLFKFLSDNGIDGVFCIGSYGSFPLLELEERKYATKLAIEKSAKYGLKNIIQVGTRRPTGGSERPGRVLRIRRRWETSSP